MSNHKAILEITKDEVHAPAHLWWATLSEQEKAYAMLVVFESTKEACDQSLQWHRLLGKPRLFRRNQKPFRKNISVRALYREVITQCGLHGEYRRRINNIFLFSLFPILARIILGYKQHGK